MTASTSTNGGCVTVSEVTGAYFGSACLRGTASFSLYPLAKADIDWEGAKHLGVCVLFTFRGASYGNADAVLFPQTRFAPDTDSLDIAAQLLAEDEIRSEAQTPNGQPPVSTADEPYVTPEGQTFAIRQFKNLPSPYPVATVAYFKRNDAMFILTLTARNQADLEAYEPYLKEALNALQSDDMEVVPDP